MSDSRLANRMTGVLLFILFMILSIPCICSAQPLPDELLPYEIARRTSEHFTVRYPKSAEDYAQKTIQYAEYVYGIWSQIHPLNVDQITIQLFDRNDVYLDYLAMDIGDDITIYLWPPENPLEYPYYGEWLEEQISSRIARIVIQRTSSDFFHSFNNMILPPWYLDGFANLYTFPDHPGIPRHQGIIRAIIRSAVHNRTMPELEALMAGNHTWMGYSVHEIIGTAFLNEVAERYGFDKLFAWIQLNGDNFSSIDHNAEVIYGKNWSDLYREWIEKEQREEAYLPIHSDKQYLSGHYLNELPQRIPGQHAVSYVHDDGEHPKAIVKYDLDSREETRIIECHGQCEHHWSGHGETLYYTTLIRTSHYVAESIYALDSGSHVPRRLPIPGHIRSFTENNGIIVAVTMLNNRPQIYRFDTLEGNRAELIYTAPSYSLIEGVTALRNEQWVASYYDPDKRQFDLILITDKNDFIDIQPITDSAETEMYPFVMHDGAVGYVTENDGYYYLNRVLSDGSDHSVLYRHDTAMVQPVQSGDGTIYYTDISEKGMAVAALRSFGMVDEGSLLQPMTDSLAYSNASPWNIESDYDDSFDSSVLIPSTYLPALGTSDTSGWFLGVYLENDDVLNHHLYNFYFAWYFGSSTFDLELSYKWHRYRWWLSPEIGVGQETYIVDTGMDYHHYPLTSYWAGLSTGTDYHFPLLDIELSFKILAEFTKTNDHAMDDIFAQWMEQIDDKSVDIHHRWTNAIIAGIKLSHTHRAPETLPGKTGYIFEYHTRYEPPAFGNYTHAWINWFKLKMAWSMPWREVDVFGVSLKYGLAVTGRPYRYSLEVESGSGFDFNYFGLESLVDFHGIRSGILMADNHLLHGHLDYSLPIFVLKNNYFRIPWMFRRMGLAVVGDWAVKSDQIDRLDFSSSFFGCGAELYLDMLLLHRYPLRIEFGYERGFAKAGENAYYLWIGL